MQEPWRQHDAGNLTRRCERLALSRLQPARPTFSIHALAARGGLLGLLPGTLASGSFPTAGAALGLLLHEAGGGLLFGLVLGTITFRLLRSVDNYKVEVLLTLAAVTGG